MTAATARAESVPNGVSDMERLMGGPKGIAVGDSAEDAGILRLTPDKTRIVRLDQDAASVIVTNPAHASVLLDSPRLLVVMPRIPGSTSFTVLNSKGQTIMEKTVIVSAADKPKYVRIRRMCEGAGASCVPSAYFYCPDGCYEVLPVPPDNGGTQVPEIPAGLPPSAMENMQPPPAPPGSSETPTTQAPAK